MDRLIFFALMFCCIISSALAQNYGSESYNHGYGAYQPAGYYTQTPDYQQPARDYGANAQRSLPEEYGVLPFSGPYPNWPYASMPPDESLIDTSKPIEIWLGKRIGRWGDYWFHALGGKDTHRTPRGTFTVNAMHKEFYSRKYDSPMPRSLFFTEQCAIHVGSLRVKSHGCIHVDWPTGELLYRLAKTGKTKVKVYN